MAYKKITKIISKDISQEKSGIFKYGIKLCDGNMVEAMCFPQYDFSVCVSTQVGCPIGCVFCESGKGGFLRNLSTKEILDQYNLVSNDLIKCKKIKNIHTLVYMGIGEPLLNYENVIESIKEINIKNRNIEISVCTVGVVDAIYKLAKENISIKLCVSLHATTDTQRKKIIPLANNSNIKELLEAIYYFEKNRKKGEMSIAIHYLMFDGFNDSIDDAKRLVNFFGRGDFEIVLKSVCPIENQKFFESKKENIELFINILNKNNIKFHYSPSRGRDIKAGCGQLRRKIICNKKIQLQ